MDDPFSAPEGTSWTPVSERLATMRRAVLVAGAIAASGLGIGLGAAVFPPAGIAVVALAGVGTVAGWLAIGSNQRSWGYAGRVDDLLVTHGALCKQLVVVPYGRMQLVDVEAGPLQRTFGIVTVRLHTAAATTDARIRGLPPDQASTLREHLAALGEAHAAGL